MENRNDFEPSDLIYLFLDGEADGVQQTMLFGMLAASSDMQAEFSEALQLRSAIETERSDAAPPAALTRDLFEKAGFAIAPATTAAISSSAALPAAILGLLRRFGVPLLCAAAGALLTALLFTDAGKGRMTGPIPRLSMEGENRSPIAGRASAAEAPRPDASEATGMTEPGASGRSPLAAIHADGRGSSQSRERGMAGTAAIDGATHPASMTATRDRHHAPPPVGEHAEEHATEGEAVVKATVPAVEPTAMIGAATALRDTLSPGDLPAMRSASIASVSVLDEPATVEEHGFSLQLRGMTDLRFFPSLEASKEAQPWFNNMSLGGLYHLSSNQAVGLELGQEYLPMYHASGEGTTRDDHISWVTGLYLLQGDPIAILGGVRPFAQGGLGTSGSGPVGKGTIGLSYAPEERVDLAIGAEGTAFFYHLDGTWYSARKAGITYMMRVHF